MTKSIHFARRLLAKSLVGTLKASVFLLFISVLCATAAPHQPKTAKIKVSGKITTTTGEALVGASVIEKGSQNGTTTNPSGDYSLNVNDNAVLVVSFIGYETKEVAVNNKTQINVELKARDGELEQVVVVGYGSQRKAALTNAVSTISPETITRRPVTNAQQALQGAAAGLTVIDGGGMPGRSSATLRVRGLTTLNSNNPLIIVDGVEQTFFDMNPEDIESVSILKDATSTAIYGSRGANGVVVVTTKRGKGGKAVVTYNGYYAIQKSNNLPEMMDLEPYMQMQRAAYQNVNATIPARFSEQSIKDWVSATDRLKYPLPNTWYQTILKPAPQQSHTVSVSGGSETFRGRMSVRHTDVAGIAPNYNNNVGEVRVNTDFDASKWLRFSTDMNYRTNYSESPNFDIFNTMYHGSLWAVPKYSDGTYGLSQQGNNPLMYAEISGYNRQQSDRMFASVKSELDILKSLTASVQYTYLLNSFYGKNFANSYVNKDQITGIVKTVANNSLTESRSNGRETNLIGLLTYKNSWQNHNVEAMGGYQEIYTAGNDLSAYRERFYNNDLQSIGAGTNDATKSNSGSDYTEGLKSFFGRVNYNFKEKYFLEFASRYDASSRFSVSNQFAFFPSGSLGWRISEERFFEPMKAVVNDLKLRASHGITGNNQIANYLFFPQLQQITYTLGGGSVQGYRENILIDPNLTWEKNIQTNVGIDFSALNKALTFTVDWYKKRSKDILLNLPIPFTTGLAPGPQNAATVDNDGIEFTANYTKTTNNDFRYQLGGNLSINTNVVVDLAGTGPYISGSDIDPRYITAVGIPYNAFWGYKTSGLLQNDTEAATTPYFQRAAKPGDVAYVDKNGDKQINADDMDVIGNPFPKFMYGATQSVGYKGFELNLQWQGAADFDVRLSGALVEQGNYEGFTHKIYTDNYWTPQNLNARFPRPTKLDLRNQATTDRVIIDGSYLRLKTIQLGYNIPTNVLKKIKSSRAMLYVSATNLLTFSKLNEWNLDPEVPSGRATYYPQTSVVTIGTNISF